MKLKILSSLAVAALASSSASAQDSVLAGAEAFSVCITNFIASGEDGNFDQNSVQRAFGQVGYTHPTADPLVRGRPGIGYAGLIKFGEFYDYNFNRTIGQFGRAVHVPASQTGAVLNAVRPVAARYGEILAERDNGGYANIFLQPGQTGSFSIHIDPVLARDYPGHTAIYIQYNGQ